MRRNIFITILFFVFFIMLILSCKKVNNTKETIDAFSEIEIEEELIQNSSKAIEYDDLHDILIANDFDVKDYNAVKLNEIGYKLYEEKKYKEAEIVFREAVKKDPHYLYANYNLACVLSITLYESKNEVDAIVEIFQLLEKCINLDSKRVDKIKSDSDLDNIREFVEYRNLMKKYDKFTPEEGTFIGKFTNSGHVEYSKTIGFEKENGEKIYFASFAPGFDDSDFFIMKKSENDGFPIIESNSANIGKKYRIYYKKDMVANEWAGDVVEGNILMKAEEIK